MFLLLLHPAKTQFNLQVGYNLGFVNLDNTQKLLQQYKLDKPWVTSDFQKINCLNGFMVGIRQGWPGFALGLNWKYRFADTKAEGIEPTANTEFVKEIFLKFQTYSLNLETGGGWLQLGTSIDLNKLSFKERHTGTDDKSLVSSEEQWGSQFYININFPTGNSSRVILQPYYFMPWNEFSLNDLNSDLNPGVEARSTLQSLSHFGISLILSNGPQ
jgi:hypothetical protein